MAKMKGNSNQNGVSDSRISQAQKLQKTLHNLGERLEWMTGRLQSLHRIIAPVAFLDEEPIAGLTDKNRKLHEQVLKLQWELEDFISGNKPVTVVVAGGFSAGKSTFLNGILGTDLLIMQEAPASKMIVNIQYGPKESYYLISSGSTDSGSKLQRRMLSRAELRDLQLGISHDDLPHDAELEINLDNELLRSLTFVDTPGLKAVKGTGGDTQGTMRAVTEKSDILFWLIDARKGTIPEGDRSRLEGLAASAGHPVIILNMMDELFAGAEDIEDTEDNERKCVRDSVTKELDKLFKKKDYTLLDYSARLVYKHQPTEVKQRKALNILTRGLSEALLESGSPTSFLGSGNNLLVAAFEGPCLEDLANESAKAELKKSDNDLINAKAKLLKLLKDVVKNRSSLMLRYDLAAVQLKKSIGDLESALDAQINTLQNQIKTKKKAVFGAFEKGASYFQEQFNAKYNKLLDDLHSEYCNRNIKQKVIRESGWFRGFKGKVRLLTTVSSQENIKRMGLSAIIKEASKLTEEFAVYGLDEKIMEDFKSTIGKLIEELSQEAWRDLIDIVRSIDPEDKKTISIPTYGEKWHKYLLDLLSRAVEILLKNKVLSAYCEEAFIQKSKTSIERFFDNLEDSLRG